MTSMLKFLRAVQNCTAPLSDGERLVLWSLAIEADYNTGKNSHPGNTRLAQITRRTPQGVLYIVRGLLAKGLIEKTREGHPSFKGQSAQAAWYRICLENPVFPDRSDHESEETETMKAQTFTVEQIMKAEQADHESKHPPTMKAESADHESSDFHSPLVSPINPSLPSLPEIRKADGGKDSSEPSAKEIQETESDKFFGKHHKTMGRCEKKTRRQIEDLAEQEGKGHPWELMNEIAFRFQNRTRGLVGLRDTWGNFLTEAPQNISDLKQESWWQESFDPEEKARIEKVIERQRQERVWLHADPEPEPELVLAPGQLF
jgi:hypothetical protein